MMLTRIFRGLRDPRILKCPQRHLNYVQGQYSDKDRREYFYYIDHQGQLFLDDSKMKNFTSCFKEKQFLAFFFKRLKSNETGSYEDEFPYVSPCGREMNYIRCDDRPIVFTQILPAKAEGGPDLLSFGGAGDLLAVDMEPEKICMLPESGRIYHPCPDKYGEVGLIKSSIAIDISPLFEFAPGKEYDPPTHFTWKGKKYELTNELVDAIRKESKYSESEG